MLSGIWRPFCPNLKDIKGAKHKAGSYKPQLNHAIWNLQSINIDSICQILKF